MTVVGRDGFSPRTFRCDDRVFEEAAVRAGKLGLNMSQVLRAFLQAYADGELSVSGPEVIVRVSGLVVPDDGS